jgi:hypothetical protein
VHYVPSAPRQKVKPQFTWACALSALVIGGGYAPSAWTQGSADKVASTASAGTGADSKAAAPFSIETEMLTYRALESNSEAIGCDVASYLSGAPVQFTNGPEEAGCQLKPGSKIRGAVIIVPFNSSAFEDFRVWRAEMDLMHQLHDQAQKLCPEGGRGLGAAAAQAAVSAAKSVAGGPLLSLAQGLMGVVTGGGGAGGLTPVVGTIQDQAFMDGAARELRRLNITVLMPSAYAPFDVSSPAAKESPFISGLTNLLDVRGCLLRAQGGEDGKDTDRMIRQQLIGDIDGYMAALQGFTTAALRGSDASNAASATEAPGQRRSTEETTTVLAPVVSSAPPAVLLAVLAGDGFAQELGVDPATGLLPIDQASPHVLVLKALESGGTVATSGGGMFKPSKTRYSGGSVGTFSLFSLNGELECSGNVYDYGGVADSNNFPQDVRTYHLDPSKQYIFQRGSCQAAAAP